MPLNDGDVHFVTRRVPRTTPLDEAIAEIRAAERRDALARMSTDLTYRNYHEETYGPSLVASEAMARANFMIPHLTRTPVDTWMARLRGSTVA